MESHFNITADVKERMRRIFLFEPLHELSAKRQVDEDGKEIHQ